MTITRVKKEVKNRQDWRTPRWLFDHYNAIFNFTTDVAATGANSLCPNFLKDAFGEFWGERVWCNPPYNDIGAWVEETLLNLGWRGRTKVVVMLLPARTSRPWFRTLMENGAHITFLEQRVKFIAPPDFKGKRNSPAEDSIIAILTRTLPYP